MTTRNMLIEARLEALQARGCPLSILADLYQQKERLNKIVGFLDKSAFILPVIPATKGATYAHQARWARLNIIDGLTQDTIVNVAEGVPDHPYFMIIPEQHLVTEKSPGSADNQIRIMGMSSLTLSETIALAQHSIDLVGYDLAAMGSVERGNHRIPIITRTATGLMLVSTTALSLYPIIAVPYCFARFCL